MTWEGSDRRARLPKDWDGIRRRVLRRDRHRCQWKLDGGGICGKPATEVDHVVRGDDHRDANLRSLCVLHHRRKTGMEGAAARNRHLARRPAEEHPADVMLRRRRARDRELRPE